MENHKQIHANGTCHAFIGVRTGRGNGDQDNKAEENQITRGLLILLTYHKFLPHCSWENSGERGTPVAFNMCDSLSHMPP